MAKITIDTSPVSVAVLAQWVLPSLSIPAGGSVDLSMTLPTGTPVGGTFALSVGTLPTGITLTPSGILAVATNTVAGATTGLVFAYAYTL